MGPTLDVKETKILINEGKKFCEERKDKQLNNQDTNTLKLGLILEDFKHQSRKEFLSDLAELNERIETKMFNIENDSMKRNVEISKYNRELVEGMREEIITMQKKAEEEIRIEFRREMEKLRQDLRIQRNFLKNEEHIKKMERECGCLKLERTSVETESDEEMGSKECLVFSEGYNTDTGERKRTRKLGNC